VENAACILGKQKQLSQGANVNSKVAFTFDSWANPKKKILKHSKAIVTGSATCEISPVHPTVPACSRPCSLCSHDWLQRLLGPLRTAERCGSSIRGSSIRGSPIRASIPFNSLKGVDGGLRPLRRLERKYPNPGGGAGA
jgi:hypothetical protein